MQRSCRQARSRQLLGLQIELQNACIDPNIEKGNISIFLDLPILSSSLSLSLSSPLELTALFTDQFSLAPKSREGEACPGPFATIT